jgi:trans-aconitate methyltransferase
MTSLYQQDLAYIQAASFSTLARGAAPEIVRRLRAAQVSVQQVLDVGCGAGPLTQSLLEAGFDVTGIDPSADLLGIARTTNPQATFIQASIYDVTIPPCQAIVALGEPLTYHPQFTDAEHLIHQLFERAAAALPPGGLLIFDVIESLIESGAPPLTARVWKSAADWAILVDTAEDPSTQSLVRTIETFRLVEDLYRRGREVHYVHLFNSQALSDHLSACGFDVETARAYGDQQLGPRRLAFFATRRTR